MKVSVSWLQDFIKIAEQPQALAHTLTMAGLEVGAVERRGDESGVYAAKKYLGRLAAVSQHVGELVALLESEFRQPPTERNGIFP